MHIAHDGDLIWGTGETLDDALTAARTMIGTRGEVDETWPEPQASINKTLDNLLACPATDALIAEVESRGGDIAWGYRYNVACTRDEEQSDAT